MDEISMDNLFGILESIINELKEINSKLDTITRNGAYGIDDIVRHIDDVDSAIQEMNKKVNKPT